MQHMLIQGGLGAGKTFIMSLLAHHWKEQVRKQGGTVKLFSNYNLKDSDSMESYKDWYKVAEAQGSIICWDEAHIAFNNRAWSKFGQGISTEVMMYTRKMKSVQIYATPSVGNVDSRIRQIIEVLVTVRKDKKGFHLYFQDFQTGVQLRTAFFPHWKAKQIHKLNLYDTYEFVRGFPVPNTEKQADEFWDELDRIHKEARGGLVI